MSLQERTLAWLDMQGYCLTDEEKRRLAVPIKFAPAVCFTITAASVAFQWWPGLAALSAVAFAGGILPRHPFDYVYGVALNPLLKTGWAPANAPQRRFACLMASALLAATAWGFAADVAAVGWGVGMFTAAAMFVVASTNWCMPSFIYNTAASLLRRGAAPVGG